MSMNPRNIRHFKIKTINERLIVSTCIIIGLMALLAIYSLVLTQTYRRNIDGLFDRNEQLIEIADLITEADRYLVTYLSAKNSSSLNEYMYYSDSLITLTERAVATINERRLEDLMMKDIHNMVLHYVEESNQAVDNKRKSYVSAYTENYKNAFQIKGYILSFIDELKVRQLDQNTITYEKMSQKVQEAMLFNTILILDLIIFAVLMVIRLSRQMIRPIEMLSHRAEAMAQGDLETPCIIEAQDDELAILAHSFERMRGSLLTYIDEIQVKAKMEVELRDQQMENLKMQSLLDNAKLYALQSQMNPHFLYNTINAGVQMAMMEGADRTSVFLGSMSRLFRYNSQHLEQPVSLQEEVNNISDYANLLHVRFGDFIEVRVNNRSQYMFLKVPPLIIQPLVENAYIHGLSHVEEGGEICITIEDINQECHISVQDNGVGMQNERIKDVLYGVHKAGERKSIGLKNVKQRLELFYGQENLLTITSRYGEYTEVRIRIPIREEVE